MKTLFSGANFSFVEGTSRSRHRGSGSPFLFFSLSLRQAGSAALHSGRTVLAGAVLWFIAVSPAHAWQMNEFLIYLWGAPDGPEIEASASAGRRSVHRG